MKFRELLNLGLSKLGYEVCRFDATGSFRAKRTQLFRSNAIDLVLDVGANTGQFAQTLRGQWGYGGRIVSFEPLDAEFLQLAKKAGRDPLWEAHNLAVGDSCGEMEINRAGNSVSSSLLTMLPLHAAAAPQSSYISKAKIRVDTLDNCFKDLRGAARNIYLKIDTQGYESKVIQGAANTLSDIKLVQMELSLLPLYAGELCFQPMCELMYEKGYTLCALDEGFRDEKSGQILQVDGIFRRSERS